MSTLEMIEAAAERLRGHVRETPILTSPFLDKIAGRRVLVKPECLQHTGSFKFRGAWSAISALGDADRQRGVIAYSSGNHAQGVAYAAAQHGISSVIVMPSDAPQLKINNTRALGGEVVLYDRANESREEIGEALASQRSLTLIRPYDEPQVIAGQGTVGLELARQTADLGIEKADVLVCCGGGGLTSGIALALEGHAPGLRARPCEPQGFDDVKRSLATGHIQSNNAASGNICDAILTPEPGQITFPILNRLCGPGLSVSEEDALRAMAQAFLRLKIVLEPGGAVSLASALFRAEEIEGDTVIVVASGGNADPEVFGKALEYLT
ncbi:threonine ammonia-lyase [Ruegeria atlantica]|uniref:threonine ammonia-lyase n=1 Tax=Ruegeria atlantica TaxID=81569 RepID=UPI0024953AE8|nr:threonine/serine dehydratase [Ruegeria atlantica]